MAKKKVRSASDLKKKINRFKSVCETDAAAVSSFARLLPRMLQAIHKGDVLHRNLSRRSATGQAPRVLRDQSAERDAIVRSRPSRTIVCEPKPLRDALLGNHASTIWSIQSNLIFWMVQRFAGSRSSARTIPTSIWRPRIRPPSTFTPASAIRTPTFTWTTKETSISPTAPCAARASATARGSRRAGAAWCTRTAPPDRRAAAAGSRAARVAASSTPRR